MQSVQLHEPEQRFSRGLVFIPQTGTQIKDPAARKLLKRRVTQHASKYRRKSGLIRRHSSLQYSLEVDDSFSVDAVTTNSLLKYVPEEDTIVNCASSGVGRILYSDHDTLACRVYNAATSKVLDFRIPLERIGIGSVDPFARYPFALNKRAQELMHLVHFSNAGRVEPFTVVPFRTIWLEITCQDAASFHQYIAGAQAFFDFTRKGDPSSLVVAHRACALRLTNYQISKAKSVSSDGVIASLLLLARYDQMYGNFQHWRMHMLGLRETIRARGDIDEIGMNELLRYMISNYDICGSFPLDDSPFFPMPTKALEPAWLRLPTIIEPFPQFFLDIWRSQLPEHMHILDLIGEIIPEKQHLLDEIAYSNSTIWTETIYVWHHINPLLYRMLHVSRQISSSPSSLIAEALRLGSIIFLATIRYAFGISPFQCGIPTHKIKVLFEIIDHNGSEEAGLDVGWPWIKVWLLGCAVINRPSGPDGNWFLDRLHLEMESLGLISFDDFEDYVGFFLWIPEVHGVLLRTGSARSI